MNTETLQQLSQQADALQQSIDALTDPDKAAAAVQQAVEKQQVAEVERRVAREIVRRRRNKADKTLKSGNYVYTTKQYGNARMTASGAVYIADKKGWRRVKGKAALDLQQMMEREAAKSAAVSSLAQAALEGRAA